MDEYFIKVLLFYTTKHLSLIKRDDRINNINDFFGILNIYEPYLTSNSTKYYSIITKASDLINEYKCYSTELENKLPNVKISEIWINKLLAVENQKKCFRIRNFYSKYNYTFNF